jgi:ribose transport system permease protein
MNKALGYWKKYGMFALLGLLILVFGLASPDRFFTSTTMFNILKQASVVGVLSCGVSFLLIMGDMDISIGSRVAFTTIVCGNMLNSGVDAWIVVLTGLAIGALTGALNALLVQILHTYSFVVSMAMMYVWTGICDLMNGAVTLYGFPDAFKNISQYMVFGTIPSIILIFVVCAMIAGFILSKTRFGRYVYAIGGNREAAFLAGIDVKKNSLLVHAFAGIFIGLAAIILMSRTMTAQSGTGGTFAFDTITACVLGGVLLGGGHGKMYQAILGVLAINVIFNGLTLIGVNDYWQMVVKGSILMLAIGIEVLQRFAKVDLSTEGGAGKGEQESKPQTA